MDDRVVVKSGENDVVEEGWRLIRTAVIILARIIQTTLNHMRKPRRLRTSGVGDSGLTVYDVEWCIYCWFLLSFPISTGVTLLCIAVFSGALG